MMPNFTFYYNEIKEFYGDRTASRSKVPLIQHIDEGLKILKWINASDAAKAAYCVHPIFQSDNDVELEYREGRGANYDPLVMLLVMEYRSKANAWLSTTIMDDNFEPPTLPIYDVKCMLVADKIQTYKDFLHYQVDTHPRAEELGEYFDAWHAYLGADRYLTFCLSLIE